MAVPRRLRQRPTLDETFGLIDTAEKSAAVLVKVYSMGGMKQTITREELIALGKRFGVTRCGQRWKYMHKPSLTGQSGR